MTKFRIYNKVVVPEHGLGTITGETMFGDVECFEIQFPDKSIQKIPKRYMLKKGVRFPADIAYIKVALKKLLTTPAPIKARNYDKLRQKHKALLDSGDLVQIATLIRDTFTPAEHNSLQAEFYPRAVNRFLEEVLYVLEQPSMGSRGVIEAILCSQDRHHLEAALPPGWVEALNETP